MHTHLAIGRPEVTAIERFCTQVKIDTNGMIDISLFPGAALGYKGEEVADVVQSGLLEMGELALPWIAGGHPILDLLQLPFLISGDMQAPPKAFAAAKPYVEKDLAERDLVMTFYGPGGTFSYLCSKEPCNTVADWDGTKFRAWSAAQTKWFPWLGCTPVSMSSGEQYLALQTGTIEGVIQGPASTINRKVYEVCDYYNLWGSDPPCPYIIVMKKSMLEALPQNYQDIIWKRADELTETLWQVSHFEVSYRGIEAPAGLDEVREVMTVLDVSPEEDAKMKAIVTPYWDEWLEEAGAEGLEALNAVLVAQGLEPYK